MRPSFLGAHVPCVDQSISSVGVLHVQADHWSDEIVFVARHPLRRAVAWGLHVVMARRPGVGAINFSTRFALGR